MKIVRIGDVKYITDPQDINAHLIGELEEPGGEHLPIVRLEPGEVLSLGCPVPALIVLLELGASLSVADGIAEQCADLRVYSQVMSTAGGVKRGAAYVATEGDEAAAALARELAAAKPSTARPAKKAKKQAKKPAKKVAKAKAKAKAKPAAEKPKAPAKRRRLTAKRPPRAPHGSGMDG